MSMLMASRLRAAIVSGGGGPPGGGGILDTDYPGLIAFYDMDDRVAGTINDLSPNGRDITTSLEQFNEGIIGDAWDSSGANRSATSGVDTGYKSSTGFVSFWAGKDTAANFNRVFGIFDPGVNNYFQFFVRSNGKVTITCRNATYGYNQLDATTAPADPNAMNHYVISTDGVTFKVWVNGVSSAWTFYMGNITPFLLWTAMADSADTFKMGVSVDTQSSFGNGKLDQLRIVDQANHPTQDDVDTLFNEPLSLILSTNHPNLLAMYTGDNVSGGTMFDESPNGVDAAITGGVTFPVGLFDNEIQYDAVDGSTEFNSNVVGLRKNVTISGWLTRDTSGIFNLFTMHETVNASYYIQLYARANGAGLRLDLARGGGASNQIIEFNSAIGVGERKHVIFEALDTEYRCYIDGVATSVSVLGGANDGDWGDTIPAGSTPRSDIGMLWHPSGPFPTAGRIDQWRAFDLGRGLTQEEVDVLYQESFFSDQIAETTHPNLVAMYTADNESGGIMFDESQYGHDLTASGAPSYEAGKVGNAVKLTTTATKFDAAVAVGNEILTPPDGAMSWWLRADATSTYHMGLSLTDAAQSAVIQPFLNKNTNQWNLNFGDGLGGGHSYKVNHTVVTGTWYHCVWQKNGIAMEFYIDGVKQTFASGVGAHWAADFADADNYFLRINNGTQSGTYDQMRMFNRALTQDEINTLYNAGAGI